MTDITPWSVRAVNLPDHADNVVHTDAGAKAAGFEAALVAGTTVYAYLTHPVVAAWGRSWVESGGGELRLRRPVLQDDLVTCTPAGDQIDAQVDGETRAMLLPFPDGPVMAEDRGEIVGRFDFALGDAEADYAMRAGDDLTLYVEDHIAHPVTWLNLANTAFIRHFVDGPWVHVRSRFAHQEAVRPDAELSIETRMLRRFDSRAGKRVEADVIIRTDGRAAVIIEHEAIMKLA